MPGPGSKKAPLPRRLAVGRIKYIGVGDPGRAGEIKYDSRAARHHQTIAECLDQPAPRGTDVGWKLEAELGDIDDHAVGIGKRKGPKRDGLVEIKDEAGLLAVTSQAGIGGDRKPQRPHRFR